MIKVILLFLFSTVSIFASEKVVVPGYLIISGLIAVIALFFWSIYKAVKTQNTIYALGMLPFILLLAWMFFI